MTVVMDGAIVSSEWEFPAGQAEYDTTEIKYNGTGFAGAARCNIVAGSADHTVTANIRNAASIATQEAVVDFDIRRGGLV